MDFNPLLTVLPKKEGADWLRGGHLYFINYLKVIHDLPGNDIQT